jgi:hypothetical protein
MLVFDARAGCAQQDTTYAFAAGDGLAGDVLGHFQPVLVPS